MIPNYHNYILSRLVTVLGIVSADFICGPFLRGELHSHEEDTWELIYCANGAVLVDETGQQIQLKRNEFLLVPPQTEHNITVPEETGQVFDVTFTCADFDQLCEFEHKIIHVDDTMRVFFMQIKYELEFAFCSAEEDIRLTTFVANEFAPYGAEQLITNYLELILLLQLRKYNSAYQNVPDRRNRKKTHSQIVRDITIYINDHLSDDFTIEEIAQHFHYSRSWLSTVFKKETGMGIREMIIQKRIGAAKEQLAHTNRSVTEIAESVGIASLHYFSRLFVEKVGCSPTQYRQRMSTFLPTQLEHAALPYAEADYDVFGFAEHRKP